MKLEVGMYVRTASGYIYKLGYYNEAEKRWICVEKYDWYPVYESSVIKASHNIIDLIEVGDYVNGKEIAYIDEFGKYIAICETDITTRDFEGRYEFKKIKEEEEIKSIVTKEQFSQMQYKVGE